MATARAYIIYAYVIAKSGEKLKLKIEGCDDGGCTQRELHCPLEPRSAARPSGSTVAIPSSFLGIRLLWAMGKEPKSRIHACPQCDYKTGNVSDLRKHVRAVHEKRRDHACPLCDATCGGAGSLRRHVRTVHEQRRDHACPQCDAAFGQASKLTRHVRAVHRCSPCKQLGDVAPGIWSHALLNLVQSGKGNTVLNNGNS